MPRTTTILSIFIASPSDVADERQAVVRAIQRLNLQIGPLLNVQLEPLTWESHARPAVGKDPQSTINSQLGDDYDICIGVFWGRAGTPTPRAESGSIEEIERAIARHTKAPHTIEIMLYFKMDPLPVEQIDAAQFQIVQSFKKSLIAQGTLYWQFKGTSEFEILVMQHLSSAIRKLVSPSGDAPSAHQAFVEDKVTEALADVDTDDELGFLDLEVIMDERSQLLVNVTERMTSSLERMGVEVSALSLNSSPSMDGPTRLRLINGAAEIMSKFTTEMQTLKPEFSSIQRGFFDVSAQTVVFFSQFAEGDSSSIEIRRSVVQSIRNFKETYEVTRSNIMGMRNTISELPRATSALNKAKRACVSVLDNYIQEFSFGIDQATMLVEKIETIKPLPPPDVD